jgi:hypothetical protein
MAENFPSCNEPRCQVPARRHEPPFGVWGKGAVLNVSYLFPAKGTYITFIAVVLDPA